MEQKKRIETLVAELNRASQAYYSGAREEMSDHQWDALFDELTGLEEQTGYLLPDSPTRRVSYEGEELLKSNGQKEAHEYPALSLAKTKEVEALQKWAQDYPVWLSWKLDGLTLVLSYDEGKLTKILTRGSGNLGTNITAMQEAIVGIPAEISEPGHLVVRGEAVIAYKDFARINDTIEDEDGKYANPRNLAVGTLGLDAENLEKAKERSIQFIPFTLVHTDKTIASWGARMAFLDSLGFQSVEREATDAQTLPQAVARFTEQVESGRMDLPVDGLVLCYDDTEFAATGSVTGHHATRAGLAFKWQDVSATTMLRQIEWSCAVSTITPVAIFDPVQLEGTTVSRASLCNLSELERLGMGAEGQTTIEVIKANKIIPKCIAVKAAQGSVSIPTHCPVCHAETEIRQSLRSQVKTLHCTNAACPAKHVKRFSRFVSKQGMDIDGLSTQTVLKFMNLGYLSDFADIYTLEQYRAELQALEGMGEKSCQNLLDSIERSRRVHPANLLFALGIPLIGMDAAKKCVARLGFDNVLLRLKEGTGFEDVDGIGSERSNAMLAWYGQEKNRNGLERLLAQLHVIHVEPEPIPQGRCQGLSFVITGDVQQFENRDAFTAYVEQQGGAVKGSISKKTNYLVNNDLHSETNKNKKARELGIPILTEADFMAQFGEPHTQE